MHWRSVFLCVVSLKSVRLVMHLGLEYGKDTIAQPEVCLSSAQHAQQQSSDLPQLLHVQCAAA